MKSFVLPTLAAALVATNATAQTQPSSWSYSLGAATIVAPVYDGAESYKTRLVPALGINGPIGANGTLNVAGTAATYSFPVSPNLTLAARGEYAFGRDSSDDDNLAGMDDIDPSLRFGPEVRYNLNPALELNARVLTDVLESNNGTTARAGAAYKMPLSQRTLFTADTGLTYASENYMDTYHGVSSANATATRAAYNPSAGFHSVDAGIGLRHILTPKLALQGSLGADVLLGDAADSPLTDRTVNPKATVGLLYRF